MYPDSYNFCAMPIVRDGDRPRRVDAVCWRVEVVNGARGERDCSDSSTRTTFHLPAFAACNIFSASSSVFGSSVHVAVNDSVFPPEADSPPVDKSAVITQNFSGTNARISRSRSIMIRNAGD